MENVFLQIYIIEALTSPICNIIIAAKTCFNPRCRPLVQSQLHLCSAWINYKEFFLSLRLNFSEKNRIKVHSFFAYSLWRYTYIIHPTRYIIFLIANFSMRHMWIVWRVDVILKKYVIYIYIVTSNYTYVRVCVFYVIYNFLTILPLQYLPPLYTGHRFSTVFRPRNTRNYITFRPRERMTSYRGAFTKRWRRYLRCAARGIVNPVRYLSRGWPRGRGVGGRERVVFATIRITA